jgi:transcriptional regulator with XRE-family HTH domain
MCSEFTRSVSLSQEGASTDCEFTEQLVIRILSLVDKENYKLQLGGRLRRARTDAGLSLQAAANELIRREGSESQAYASRIGNYEQGLNVPDAYILHLLCEIYDCDPAWLHHGIENNRLSQVGYIWRRTDERGREAIFSNAHAQPIQDAGSDSEKKSA